MRLILPAAAYFALVFAAGSALGTLRTLVLVPQLGELRAVVLELPVMLIIGWRAAGYVLRRWPLRRLGEQLAMGGLAFAMLLLAELALSLFAFDRSLAEHLAHYAGRPGAVGLAGQVAFGLFPALRSR